METSKSQIGAHAPVFSWIIGPGHSWLEVPFQICQMLGLAPMISSYSYEKTGHTGERVIYLEEDRDAFLLWAAARAHSFSYRTTEEHQRAPSCRSYASYASGKATLESYCDAMCNILTHALGKEINRCVPNSAAPEHLLKDHEEEASLAYYREKGGVHVILPHWPGEPGYSPTERIPMKEKAFNLYFNVI